MVCATGMAWQQRAAAALAPYRRRHPIASRARAPLAAAGTGWPSFYAPLKGAVKEELDLSIVFLPRTEVRSWVGLSGLAAERGVGGGAA